MSAETLSRPGIASLSEQPKTPEKFKPNFPFLTINGRAGTGKSSLASDLSRDLNMQVYDIGSIFRRWDRIFGQKSQVINYAERTTEVDKKLDEMVKRRMIRAINSGTPVIIVSRMGGWLAKELENEGFPNSPRINLTAPNEVAAKRVYEREKKKNPALSLTEDQIEIALRRRNREDYKALKRAHPELTSNPMDHGLKDSNGNKVYNMVVNTTRRTVTQTKEELYRKLKEQGFLKKVA